MPRLLVLSGHDGVRRMPGFTEVADRVWVARYGGSTSTSPWSGVTAGCSWSTPTPRRPRRARSSTTYGGSAPARWSASSTPTGTSTTPSATAPSATAYGADADPRPRERRRARSSSGRADQGALRRPHVETRTATRCSATEIVLPDQTFSSAWCSTSATGGRAGPPRPRPHRRRPRGAGPRRRRGARRRPGRGVRARRASATTVADGLAAHASTSCSGLLDAVDRRGPGARRPGRPRLRRGAAQRVGDRRRDDPRPRHPRRPGRPRRWRPAEWPWPREAAGRTPYAAATSTCPAARSGCP